MPSERHHLVLHIIHQLDDLFPKELATLILRYLDTPPIELHVTRHIVLARPMLMFAQISVYNVRISKNNIVFYLIADVDYACAFFELHFPNLTIKESFLTFPHTCQTKQTRAQFVQMFLQRTARKHGVFYGCKKKAKFDIVACDGMNEPHKLFCPGFNMFRLTDRDSFGNQLRKIDPLRFGKLLFY